MPRIHPTAIIDPSATIHDAAVLGPFCVIGPEVVIGSGTVLLDHVTIQQLTTIGEGCRIYPYAVLGADPQDRKFHGERSTCEIGDRNIIREHVTIHRGTSGGGGVTRVGSDNLVMVAAHIAHDCDVGDDVTIANQVMLAGHVIVEDGASIGGGVGVHHYATIGTCAFVGGLARCSKDVPPFLIVEGRPAEPRAVNVIGMARRGYTQDHIEAVKEAYRRLFRGNGAPMATAMEALRLEHHDVPAVLDLCDSLVAAAAGCHGRARERIRSDDKWAVPAGPRNA